MRFTYAPFFEIIGKKIKKAGEFCRWPSEASKNVNMHNICLKFLNKHKRYHDADKYMHLGVNAYNDKCLSRDSFYHYVNKNMKMKIECLKLAIELGNKETMHFYGSLIVSKSLTDLKKGISKGNAYAKYLPEDKIGTLKTKCKPQ